MLEVVRVILRRCVHQWEWLDREPRVRMLKEATRRVRFLTREEALRLLSELPSHLSEMMASLACHGAQEGQRHRLGVDAGGFGEAVGVGSSRSGEGASGDCGASETRTPLRRSVDRSGSILTHVFSYQGKPIGQVNTKAWCAALRRAQIHDFRWHDLRHTWASWHVQGGTPLHALQELGGWESSEMVRRYAHFSAEHLAPYADRLGVLRVVDAAHGTNPSHRTVDSAAKESKSLS